MLLKIYINNKMGKRGRKPSTEKRTGYFYEEEEQAFVDYMNCENQEEKDRIFNAKLLPAFTKMIESIIRRYNLFTPSEEFTDTFNDTLSFMLTKISNFDVTNGKKAYSYCGTICKNYLIYKINQFTKNQKRNASYDDMANELNEDSKFSYSDNDSLVTFNTELINETIEEMQQMLLPDKIHELTENEIKIGHSLLDLLMNWQDIMAHMGSNKFNKSSILYFLKETTLLSTKEIRDGMKKFKHIYFNTKEGLLN